MGMTATAALWFLPAVIPIAIYVSWRDMSMMKITNNTCLLLLGCYAVLGLFAFPFPLYLSQWLHPIILMAGGMVLWSTGLIGGGDVKFISAASPFFVIESFNDTYLILVLLSACLLAGLVVHQGVRFTPLRKIVPDWKSWHVGWYFPKGLPLSMTLLFYLLIIAIWG